VAGVTRVRKFVAATSGADYDTARQAAPEVELAKAGPLTVYGKCFYDESATRVNAVLYVKSSADRAIFDSEWDDKPGGDTADKFLNTDTIETDRELYDTSITTDKQADLYNYDYGQWMAMAADGTTMRGDNMVGVKRGDFTAGNGPWPSGSSCLLATSAETLG
jgi:hypothetical protein